MSFLLRLYSYFINVHLSNKNIYMYGLLHMQDYVYTLESQTCTNADYVAEGLDLEVCRVQG